MDLQVNRWGNSLAVRLPAALVRELGEVHEGDRIHVEALGPARLGLSVDKAALSKRKAWLAELSKSHENLPFTRPVSPEEMGRF